MRWASFLIFIFVFPWGLVWAQVDYPSRPVKVIVPSPPGGGTDILARVLAQHFSKALGQPFVVENKPGAGNMIGIESVARAPADGYTLLVVDHRSEEHTSELQSHVNLVCRLLLEKKKK